MTPSSSGRSHVFLALRLPQDAVARIADECEVTVFEGHAVPSKADLLVALEEVDGLLGSAQLPVDADVLRAAPRLRVVSNFGVGFDNVDLEVATERGVIVCNTPGVLSEAVADLTLGLILSLARRIPESDRFVRERRWQPGSGLRLGTDIAGKTMGIIGLGRIGVAVANRARAFGMNVIYHDLLTDPPDEASFCRRCTLEELLPESDIVSLHVNLSLETTRLMGREEFALMKPTALFINTSRGQTVDQQALVDALQNGELAGAGLDVFEREPLPADDPLLSLPNVILLPHVGSATVETRAAMRDLAIDNLLAALRGERPKAVVNPEVLGQE